MIIAVIVIIVVIVVIVVYRGGSTVSVGGIHDKYERNDGVSINSMQNE